MTVTVKERWQNQRKRHSLCTISWATGKTYPSGGIPIGAVGRYGMQRTIDQIRVYDQSNGGLGAAFTFDKTNQKIRMMITAAGTLAVTMNAHTHDLKAIGGLTSSEALFLDASQKFGKSAATDRTIVGSTSGTTGGVSATTDAGTISGSIGNLTELGHVDVGTVTLQVEVIGW